MTNKPIIWTEPLELICDGTPVVFDPDGPTNWDDHYILVREDGLYFTEQQHPNGDCSDGDYSGDLVITPEGKHWERCGPTDPVLVRNRVQMDEWAEAQENHGLFVPTLNDPRAGCTFPLIIHGEGGQEILRLTSQGKLYLDPQNAGEAAKLLVEEVARMCRLMGNAEPFADAAMMAERDKGGEA